MNEELAIQQFISGVNGLVSSIPNKPKITKEIALKYLHARKFDIDRSVQLYEQNHLTRIREGLVSLNPYVHPLRTELETGKFTILGGRDGNGAAIALFTANKHCPMSVTHQITLQGVVYQLDVALKDLATQKCGLIFIYDMSSSKYSNFDYDLSQKMLTLLKGGYPARLKKVLIVTAPLWFKAPFKILRLFVREKLRERVFTVSIPQLKLHIPRESLPIHLGGTSEINHSTWLKHCMSSMTNSEEDIDINLGKLSPNKDINVSETVPPSDTASTAIRQGTSSPHRLTISANKSPNITTTNSIVKEEVVAPKPPSESWSENPPSSASSGFSDDDSLAGSEGDQKTVEQIVEMINNLGRPGLIREYFDLRERAPDGTFNNARLRPNVSKNRYTDVLCFDHSRVTLSQLNDDPTSDYINANFVDGYKQKHAYISTQGPLPKTSADFWRMVWEQHCLVIVMTTRVYERGRFKCGQYWEPTIGSELDFESFKVKTVEIDSNEDYTVSTLEILNLKTEETRLVSHWQFTSWPDYGVPSSASAILNFLHKVREQQTKMVSDLGDTWAGHPRGPPIVVHCSAGIGRTGTFITLDICISRLEEVGTIDIRGTVEKIRSQRAFSIQMPDQYIFCHLALIEYAISKGMIEDVDLSGFKENEDDSQ